MADSLLSDITLARRLERTEAHANMAFVESRQRLEPHGGATWCDAEGTWAMFDGVGSPLTQTFGLGCFSTPTAEQLDHIESFFSLRGSETAHEVSTVADMSVLTVLGERGYRPIEWSAVLCQPLRAPAASGDLPSVRHIVPTEATHWADVSARGWAQTPELADFVRSFGVVGANAADTHAFIAELDGESVAAGSLHLHDGVALMAGASTVPAFRGRGAQAALLHARLAFAFEHGAELAMMVAAPGSASQRNAQRAGFSIAYSRIKMVARR
jgi:GNAT superfamily N-acetyltransferase